MRRTPCSAEEPEPLGDSSPMLSRDDAQAVLDLLRAKYAFTSVPPTGDVSGDRAVPAAPYLPVATTCYAIVLYDRPGIAVHRVVGLFGGVDAAEDYAHDNRYGLYDVVPATAVIPLGRGSS
jgi:hypothetical protein